MSTTTALKLRSCGTKGERPRPGWGERPYEGEELRLCPTVGITARRKPRVTRGGVSSLAKRAGVNLLLEPGATVHSLGHGTGGRGYDRRTHHRPALGRFRRLHDFPYHYGFGRTTGSSTHGILPCKTTLYSALRPDMQTSTNTRG